MDLSYFSQTLALAQLTVLCEHRASHSPANRKIGFSLDEIRHAAIANPPDNPTRHQRYRDELGLRPGGFGVLLTWSLVDEVIYGEKGNEVMLVKYLDTNLQRTP